MHVNCLIVIDNCGQRPDWLLIAEADLQTNIPPNLARHQTLVSWHDG
jgi:hypothetical protein